MLILLQICQRYSTQERFLEQSGLREFQHWIYIFMNLLRKRCLRFSREGDLVQLNMINFPIPHSVMSDVINNPHTRDQTYDLEIRRQLGIQTYQTSESIADGIRLISDVTLWREIALDQGATNSTADSRAKSMKMQLNAIVERRNKIAHEGDMQPLTPREPWPINGQDLVVVKNFIEALVNSIDRIV